MIKFPEGDTHFAANAWSDYQRIQYDTAVSHTRQQRLALDCGAHAGIMSLRMSRDFDRVIAFEPVHYRLLQDNLQHLDNVKVMPVCVSDAPGAVHMNLNRTNSGGNSICADGEYSTRAIAIDSLTLRDVDFIKMDLEGWEYPALIGAEQTIMQNRPVLLLEYEKTSPNKTQIESRLTIYGYREVFRKNADHVWRYFG